MSRLTTLFKKEDPKELVRKWQATLRTDARQIDRQIRDVQYEEKKVQRSIKEAAKRGDMTTCKTLAKEIIHSRKAISRMYTNKAHMSSLSSSLTEQLAMIRVAGTLQKSNDVMKIVNDAIKLPEMQKTMMEMSREMSRAGLIDEMMNDALDSALDNEDLEEETDAEVERVLMEVAGETLAQLPAAKQRPVAAPPQPEAEEENEEDLQQLQARLDAVRS